MGVVDEAVWADWGFRSDHLAVHLLEILLDALIPTHLVEGDD